MTEIDHTYWYLARAAGLLGYLMLFCSVSLGLSLTSRAAEGRIERFRVYDLHRFFTLLTPPVLLLHVILLLADDYFRFSPWQLLVPFASPYRPLFTALGTLGLYLGLIIVASFYVRRFISYRAWRLLHYASLATFVLATAHGIGGGSDAGLWWVRYLYVTSGLIVFNLSVYRVINRRAQASRANPGGVVAVAAVASDSR